MPSQHTPTPYAIQDNLDGGGQICMVDSEETPIAIFGAASGFDDDNCPKEWMRANITSVVRACNAHEDLLAAGQEAQTAMYDLMKAYAVVQEHFGMKPEASPIYAAALQAQKRSVAAIAKAEGK